MLFRGRVGDREVAIPVTVELPAEEPGNEALASVWARTRIADLARAAVGRTGSERLQLDTAVRDLAVDFRLASAQTSFVAVDESRVFGDGRPLRVMVPVALAQGVSYEGTVGPRPGAHPVRLESWGATLVEARDGTLYVLALDHAGPAARSGLPEAAYLTAVGGHAIRGARHLEALLLQTPATSVDLRYLHRGAVGRATMPRP